MSFQKNIPKHGFSLIEVVITIGIISITLVPLLALLPLGLKTNEVSIVQMQALDLISTAAQDLRYTPADRSESALLKLKPLPYSNLKVGIPYRFWIDPCWNVYTEQNKTASAIYELSLTYTQVPLGSEIAPTEATMTISWPPSALGNQDPHDKNSKKDRFVTLPISFPHPQTIPEN